MAGTPCQEGRVTQCPQGLTLVLASRGAPRSSSSSTTWSCPLRAAQCSGVSPSCQRARVRSQGMSCQSEVPPTDTPWTACPGNSTDGLQDSSQLSDRGEERKGNETDGQQAGQRPDRRRRAHRARAV